MQTVLPLLGNRYSGSAPQPKLPDSQAAVRARIESAENTTDWDEVQACLCQSTERLLVSEVDRHGLPYRKHLCLACGLMYVAPRWSRGRLTRFYAEEYRGLYGGGGTRTPAEDVQWIAAQRSAKDMARFIRGVVSQFGTDDRVPTVVEIGAGGGWNLAGLPREWRRIGYDFDPEYLEAGRKAFGVEMRTGFLDQAEYAVREADVVLLSHVAEHLPDPVEALRRVAGWLTPGARLIVEVPGIFRIHQTVRDPMAYMQNAHLYTFCAATISRVCGLAGLRVLHVNEWCRVVAEPGRQEISVDPELPSRIARYLKACERLWGFNNRIEKVPVIGPSVRRTFYRLLAPLLGMPRTDPMDMFLEGRQWK